MAGRFGPEKENEMSHTPGPWTPVIADGKRGWMGVWEVKSVPDLDFAHHSVVSEKEGLTEKDARLIAAAPAMLEALECLLEVAKAALRSGDWKEDGACDPSIALSRAEIAIEQATGETK
jgi:hypothetical protein